MTMTIATLHFNTIRSKEKLQELYSGQFAANYIKNEINDIIRVTRDLTMGARIFTHLISTKEVCLFVLQNGLPDGYFPSEEMKLKIDFYREEISKQRALQRNSEIKD